MKTKDIELKEAIHGAGNAVSCVCCLLRRYFDTGLDNLDQEQTTHVIVESTRIIEYLSANVEDFARFYKDRQV
ncbi:MAG: hypothetical protein PUB21_07960 [Bacteroidales bacterium]|nr:hypothetical protein [Bacteroidales bacterium]